ncbi:MAG: putative DNA binding domain-containing protein [Verrucomicrobia bacterium]|nr:putative DNA binding domain-containing protein [Verrucomicrobiota bacterium]
MSTTPEQINLWRSAISEDQRLEFKEAKTQFDFRTLCKYCVALANEGGGRLLFGIADQPPRPVVGTSAVNDPVGMAEKLFQTLGFRVDVEAVNHPDGRVVIFHIPSRPRGTAYHLEGTYFMRAGEELVPMSEDQLRRIFAEGEPDWLEEYSRTGLDAAQVVELLDTQGFFDLLKLPYPVDQSGVLDRLQQERLVDLVAGSYSIRRLGALLLAKKLPDFPDLARKAPRVVVYTGTSKLDTKLDQPGTKGYAVGFRELVGFVMSQLPQNEVIENALRREVKLVPEIAIRELVANALIHQDFRVSGASVMIEIYADRVDISNPGEPIVPVDRFIDGYQSRNERLADLMRRFAICEEKGSGVDKVIQVIENHQLPAPDFRVGFKRFSAILLAPRAFEDMDRNDRIRACYQHCCLCYVLHRKMTNQSLRERFKLAENKAESASRVIRETVEARLIRLADAAQTSLRYRSYVPFWG